MERQYACLLPLNHHTQGDGSEKQNLWYLPDEPFCSENNVDFSLWNETAAQMELAGVTMALIDVGDGVRYDSHPEISAPDAVSKTFLKEKLADLRARGIKPVPMLNFSTAHHAWLKDYRRMVSSSIYRKVCVDLIDEVCEVFDHPALFHLGMDEEEAMGCQKSRECVVIRGEELLWEDYDLFFDACRKNGARPWVWADYYWAHPDVFTRRMKRDVLISNRFFGRFRDFAPASEPAKAINAYAGLDKLGFEQMPACSSLGDTENPGEVMRYCPTVIGKERLFGYVLVLRAELYRENELLFQDGIRRFAAARREQ